ncbi:MAG: hypothetical protein CFE21_14720 [Bacteroidetes bacterium B1(2017)]|nr:MAG: hypothetical protein CFE21_14720 [Bacteroidetes bacterium B1(2017)]
MSYQAVVRNSSFALVVNTTIGMKISILQGTSTGAVVYSETQTPVTNANGLATIEIGGGTVVSGTFASINWANGPFFIKTETDPAGGTAYSITSTTQLLSVPYALYAANSGSSTPGPAGPAGPAGVAGPMGPQGPSGVANCTQCHIHDKNSAAYQGSMAQRRDQAAYAYEFSKHGEGKELAMGEGASTSCAPCHSNEGFTYRIANKVEPTYTGTGPYTYTFAVPASVSSAMNGLPTHISCFTCHKGAPSDSMALATKDSVKMLFYAMPGKVKYLNFPQDNSKSNLCVNCHQPRPITENTTSGNGSSLDYPALGANLTAMFYDSTKTSANGNKVNISGSTIGHYGWPGAVLAGKGFGPIEIPGAPIAYTNSAHTTQASCQNCHMAMPKIISDVPHGGHTFDAVGNYNGCNTVDCHGGSPLSSSTAKVTTAFNNQKANLDTLAELLQVKGMYMCATDTTLEADGITRVNRWYKFTTKHFTGGYNIGTKAGQFVVNGSTVATPVAGAQRWPSITNGQFACMQAFSVAIKEYSGGIHNTKYTNALLRNAIWYLRANPIQ